MCGRLNVEEGDQIVSPKTCRALEGKGCVSAKPLADMMKHEVDFPDCFLR